MYEAISKGGTLDPGLSLRLNYLGASLPSVPQTSPSTHHLGNPRLAVRMGVKSALVSGMTGSLFHGLFLRLYKTSALKTAALCHLKFLTSLKASTSLSLL